MAVDSGGAESVSVRVLTLCHMTASDSRRKTRPSSVAAEPSSSHIGSPQAALWQRAEDAVEGRATSPNPSSEAQSWGVVQHHYI